MGTRGTITIVFNRRKIIMYNHWDSYPLGLGILLLNELINLLDSNKLVKKFEQIKIVHQTIKPTDKDIQNLSKFTDLSVASQDTQDWYCLLRKCQGSILKTLECGYALNHDGQEVYNYVIDLDNKKFTCKEAKWNVDFDNLKNFHEIALKNGDD